MLAFGQNSEEVEHICHSNCVLFWDFQNLMTYIYPLPVTTIV